MLDLALTPTAQTLENDYQGLKTYGLNELRRFGITSVCDARTYWKRDHHEVAMFNSGEDALEALHATNPDVVITDLMLGSGMNGLQLAEQVRKNSPGMPLLLMSGNPESLMSSSEFETYALLKKPFSSQDLLSSIRSVVKAAP